MVRLGALLALVLAVFLVRTSAQCACVSIVPPASIQTAVDTNPTGTTFCLRQGTFVRQQVVPKSGNTFLGDPGSVMDGQNATAHAFYSNNLHQSNVTIRYLEIKNYTTPTAAHGAIHGDDVTNWVVADNIVHDNHDSGIRAGAGTGWQVLRNITYNNGRNGVTGYQCHGALIVDNEMYANGGGGLGQNGGSKILGARDLTYRGNYIHDNTGIGIWSDTNYPTTTIEDNTITNNTWAGIWHEISFAAVIRNNVVTGNGSPTIPVTGWLDRAGIQTSNSPNVEIYGNTVSNNTFGITAMYADTGGYPASDATYGARVLQNLSVHDNTITMRIGRTGMDSLSGATAIYTSLNNHFENNDYFTTSSGGAWFQWNEATKTFAQWQGFGNDDTGSLTVIP